MDNAITKFLDAIIPNVENLVKNMHLWVGIVLMIGPIIMIIKGAIYLFLAPPEANHKLGYRTFFGMGSVKAWKFTQKLAGYIWGGLGVALAILGIIGIVILSGKEPAAVMSTGLTLMIVETSAMLAAFLSIEITMPILFDINGNRRKKRIK